MIKKIILMSAVVLFLSGCGQQSTTVKVNLPKAEVNQSPAITEPVNENSNANNQNAVIENTNTDGSVEPVEIEIPAKLELTVAFASQAPFANWDSAHEEACEEASMITVAKYFAKEPLDETIMEAEIQKVDAWEKDNSYKIDLTASQVAQVLNNYYKVSARVVEEVTVDRIKYELSLGNLVIVPAAGRELNNPYFKTPGPIYHMLVIKGYDSDEFITNEVGTKRGDGFKYKYSQLIDAIHDWDSVWAHSEVSDEMMGAQVKRMVVVSGS